MKNPAYSRKKNEVISSDVKARMKMQTSWFASTAALVILLVLTLVAYLPILGNHLVIDDHDFIERWEELKYPNVSRFFQGNLPTTQTGVYRPVRSIAYALSYQVFGTNPQGYHIVSMLLHLICTYLVYQIFLRLRLIPLRFRLQVAWIGALLFGLHPVHTETIAYIAASFDTIGLGFMLFSFYSWLLYRQNPNRKHMFWCVASGLLAFFTTEMSLVLPLLIMLYAACVKDFFWKDRKNLTPIASLVTGTGIYLFIRMVVLHIGARGPYLGGSVYYTALTMTKVLVRYLELLVVPIKLVNNHILPGGIEVFIYRGYNQTPIINQSLFQPSILFSCLIIFALLSLAVYAYKHKPLYTFCILWFFVALLPVMEIIPQGSVLNEKSLFVASIGFVLLLAYFITLLWSRWRIVGIFVVALLSLAFTILVFTRTREWSDDITLWTTEVRREPKSAYGYYALGNAYADKAQYDEALAAYEKAFALNPYFAVSQASVAKTYMAQGKTQQAITAYQTAIDRDPSFFEAMYNLANIYAKEENLAKANELYTKVLQIAPGFTPAKNNLETLKSVASQAEKVTSAQSFKNKLFSFTYPQQWSAKSSGPQVIVTNPTKSFTIQLQVSKQVLGKSLSQYLQSARPLTGTLENQGEAQLPTTDGAQVKIWKTEKETYYEFFILKKGLYIHVVTRPVVTQLMPIFDALIRSLEPQT